MKKITGICLLFMLWIMLLPSCKKSSGSDSTPSSSYYMTASVGGSSWVANISNNSYHSPALAGVTSTNGVNIILLLGIKAVNKDSSAFALIFPEDITLNTSMSFNPSQYLEGVYVSEKAAGSGTYNGYNTTAVTGGSGTLTVTVFDQTNKIIEGTFSGTFGSTTGSPAITVTGGKFRCPYTTDISQVNNLSGLKF